MTRLNLQPLLTVLQFSHTHFASMTWVRERAGLHQNRMVIRCCVVDAHLKFGSACIVCKFSLMP
jgi:hypothetical protein